MSPSKTMSRAAFSVFCFGIYLAGGGVLLLLAPGRISELLGLGASEGPQGVWVRFTGMFFLILAYYCLRAAREEERRFMEWSVRTRPTTLLFLTAFAAFDLVRPPMLLFGIIDLGASVWTAVALKRDAA
jgi:hypothetical protein